MARLHAGTVLTRVSRTVTSGRWRSTPVPAEVAAGTLLMADAVAGERLRWMIGAASRGPGMVGGCGWLYG
ncbi:MAG: hypothetical protein WAN20_24990, partial [Pseudonocardiaceae bacterium]